MTCSRDIQIHRIANQNQECVDHIPPAKTENFEGRALLPP